MIAMSSVALTLILIIGAINYANYTDVINSAKVRLDMLENGGGRSPMIDMFRMDRIPHLSPEAPFDSRYFSVVLDKNGNILSSDTNHIAAIGEDQAEEMALSLFNREKTEGIIDIYAYRVLEIDGNILYLFLDHSRELDTFYSFLSTSFFVSICAFVLVFILVALFSKTAIKPIAESYEKQKRFITDAGHELKTPLTVIRAANEVIELQYGENKWTESINNQATKLAELTNKLVILSRMSEDGGLNFSMFSLSDTLKECVSYFEAVEYSKEKEIKINAEEGIDFLGDEKAIAQLFTLLTDNALKYSPAGSTIFISLRKAGKDTEIIFFNPAENVQQGNNDILFERFYRPDNSRNSEKGGHGIGLAVAKAIVDAHKGKISAKSSDGKSFQITILL